MGNNFSQLILLLWPALTVVLFHLRSTYSVIVVSIVGGYLILPEVVGFDLPFIPPMDKHSIPVLSVFFGFIIVKKRRLRLLPKQNIDRMLVFFFIAAPFLSMYGNTDSYFNGVNVVRGIRLYDALSLSISQLIFLLPLLIGYHLCRRSDDLVNLMKLMVLAIIIYSAPMLFEVRFSPQLHRWIYGFFPHSFGQQIRSGGFRPVVFLGHGLLVANILAFSIAFLSVMTRLKLKLIKGLPNIYIIAFLLVTLFLCKSLAALIFAVLMVIVILFFPIRMIGVVTFGIGVAILLYLLMVLIGWFPHIFIIEMFQAISPDRAQSLEFRFANEIQIVEHVKSKILFGWNGWGRYRLNNSTTDSYWIILMGQYGLSGLIAFFGLILVPVYRGMTLALRLRSCQLRDILFLTSFVIGVFMLDQLINNSLKSWVLLFMGAYIGLVNRHIKLIELQKTLTKSKARRSFRLGVSNS